MDTSILSSKYQTSRAIVIGINAYVNVAPLGYAVNDAKAVAQLLQDKFKFKFEDICVLKDSDATRASIMEKYLSLAGANTHVDDRLLFFFAGHGHTVSGARGEVGYLVPVDGAPGRLDTLIRWDDLTRNADLIAAKHILFLMDACYGGLAITRGGSRLPSMRFLQDMLLRPARQVLTAGKADEIVSDSGGPIPGHSIFTGHLLEALNGKAQSEDGVITANGVMSYIYEKVAKDQHSHQTPHFGFLSGDGDFIFSAPILEKDHLKPEIDEDVTLLVPASDQAIEAIVRLTEIRDPWSAGHERRVSQLTCALGAEMGLPENRIEGLRVMSYLHNIGNNLVPLEILTKPIKLSKSEYSLIKDHCELGASILENLDFPWPVARAAQQHHERMDGSGYPRGLKGGEIILEARILAVADTVAAMTSHRVYRPGLGIDTALAEILGGRDTSYDPKVVDACVKLFREKGFRFAR